MCVCACFCSECDAIEEELAAKRKVLEDAMAAGLAQREADEADDESDYDVDEDVSESEVTNVQTPPLPCLVLTHTLH